MFSLQNSKTFSSGKEDRKGEEDYHDYPADFNEMQGCNGGVSLLLSALAHNNWTHFAAVSSAHKAGCLHNHTSVVPAAKTRAQSAPANVLSSTQSSHPYHIKCNAIQLFKARWR